MDSKVSYLEIGTKNAETSRVFFEQLFGWSFHSMENNGEGWFETPSIKAGLHGNDPNPQFFVFFNVADLDTAVAKVKELGGKIEEPENDEPGFGKFCSCRDPEGVLFGLHQSS